jgi:hydroxysqualene synthase
MMDGSLDISSGKDIAYENFPVGSWLLPAALRPHIAIFYHFARAADDIADAQNLSSDDKIARLDQYGQALDGKLPETSAPPKALRMTQSLRETKVSSQHCIDLLAAFTQDASKSRYNTWQELIDYCQLSAAPVGRYLIDLHGGSQNGYGPSDALCAALQILNHLQDCQDDFQTLNRVYLPLDMMANRKTRVGDLSAMTITAELRACLNDILDGVDALMNEAAALPAGLKSWRLAMESQAIINIANKLSKKLRRNDPIAAPVKLSKLTYLSCCVLGALKSLIR